MSPQEEKQCMEALRKATEVREVKALIKRQIREGKLSLPTALTHWAVQSGTVEEMLRSQRGIGPGKALKISKACGVSPRRRVGEISERQRQRLGALL